MTSSRNTVLAISLSLIGAITASAAQAAPEFVNGLALDGAMLDKSGGTDANNGRLGYFSDLHYDANRKQWWGLSDRGPGGGVLDYQARVQRFKLKVDPNTGAISGFELIKTILFKDESGNPMNGLAPNPTNILGNAFDPEGFVVNPLTGGFYVSDEYGPSLYEFDNQGKRIRTFTTPANVIPRSDAGVPNFADDTGNTKGKRTGRGFEGLAISPDGAYVYAMLQSAMLDEGGSAGICNRIVKFSAATGADVAQYAYQMDGSSQGRGVSALFALNDHELLALERNNRGIGAGATLASPNKKIFRIDLTGATDFSNQTFTATTCPVGKVAKNAVPFLDLAANTLPELGNKVPEKWEGLTIGPQLKDGGYVLVTGTDNDYSVFQNSSDVQFDVYFRMTDADPFATSIFCPLGQTEGCFFHDANGNPTSSASPTSDYKLVPGVLHAYKVSAADLGNFVRPGGQGEDDGDDDKEE